MSLDSWLRLALWLTWALVLAVIFVILRRNGMLDSLSIPWPPPG